MGALDELRQAFQEVLDTRAPAPRFDRGLLGHPDGTLWVAGDSDNRAWFRKNGQAGQLVKVICWRVRPVYGMPVVCGFAPEQPGMYQVLSWDREALELNWAGMSSVPRHAEMHIWEATLGGDDPVMVWTRAFMPFRVSPQVVLDFTVQIQGPEMYLWLATWNQWPGDISLNLAGDYPGAGLHCYSLVYIDGLTNVAMSVPGGSVAIAMPIPLASYPTPPMGSIPLALVHLVGAAVAGNEIDESDILDSRIIVSSGPGSVVPGLHHLIDTTVHDDTDAYGAPAQGDVIRFDTDWERLARGTAHQLFKMDAAGNLPIWASFDWDDLAAAAGVDMAHDHTTALEGNATKAEVLAWIGW